MLDSFSPLLHPAVSHAAGAYATNRVVLQAEDVCLRKAHSAPAHLLQSYAHGETPP